MYPGTYVEFGLDIAVTVYLLSLFAECEYETL